MASRVENIGLVFSTVILSEKVSLLRCCSIAISSGLDLVAGVAFGLVDLEEATLEAFEEGVYEDERGRVRSATGGDAPIDIEFEPSIFE